ncbi:ribosomal RNA large subunit methyltransferase I [Nitrospirota bacterium]|nr:ribosomal RNA large subunit methyltransferase I [Nitrospirota bacterium]GDX88166.1 SAM-dependent methyltransferase [Nitrospirota bacterium]
MAIHDDGSRGQVCLSRTRALEEPGHLWIYAGYVESVSGEPVAGDVVDVLAPNGRFFARGLYNPASKIRVRILSFEDEPVTEQFWKNRLAQAVRLRQKIVTGTNAYRLVYGEADRLPGLVVDRYDDVLVMQTLSAGMDRRKDLLADLLCQESGATRVYLRNDAKSRVLEGLPVERGFLRGRGATTIEVQEGTARFLVDIERGQKTGWFCDQRENRLVAARFAAGAEVLEVFAHTGAFGIHAALAGAKSVEGLDVSEEALVLARSHAALNKVEDRCLYRMADAFDEMRKLERSGRRYDLVLLDPPAFARSKQAVPRALAGYKDVNLLGMKLTKPEGFLVTSSCSHHVTEQELWTGIRLAARDAKRQIRLLEQRGQASDHPILATMPETRYLKCFILQVF